MAMLPALYAHRLGRAYGPDSSAAALTCTLQRPLDGLETDCCLTADGELVLPHDPLLEAGTTVSGWTHERPRRRSARAGSATRTALQATSARWCSTSCSSSRRPARHSSSR
jgi:glycerophosphoryl diester phosphodiesterase